MIWMMVIREVPIRWRIVLNQLRLLLGGQGYLKWTICVSRRGMYFLGTPMTSSVLFFAS